MSEITQLIPLVHATLQTPMSPNTSQNRSGRTNDSIRPDHHKLLLLAADDDDDASQAAFTTLLLVLVGKLFIPALHATLKRVHLGHVIPKVVQHLG